jgi:hypothetical protein
VKRTRGPSKARPWVPLGPADRKPLTDAQRAATIEAGEDPDELPEMWMNDRYTVVVRRSPPSRLAICICERDGLPPEAIALEPSVHDFTCPIAHHQRYVVHLSIRRNDRKAVNDWRDLQRIKNQLCGLDAEAVELYPAEARMVDQANSYHLWCLPAGQRFPIGWDAGRVVGAADEAEAIGAGQREPDDLGAAYFERVTRDRGPTPEDDATILSLLDRAAVTPGEVVVHSNDPQPVDNPVDEPPCPGCGGAIEPSALRGGLHSRSGHTGLQAIRHGCGFVGEVEWPWAEDAPADQPSLPTGIAMAILDGEITVDEPAMWATLDLILRCGGKVTEVMTEPPWAVYAEGPYGLLLVEEGPELLPALERIAGRLVSGAECAGCLRPIAVAAIGNSPRTCRWTRKGDVWVASCDDDGDHRLVRPRR